MYVHIDRIKTCTYIHTAYIDQAKEERRKKEPIIPIPPSLSLPVYIYLIPITSLISPLPLCLYTPNPHPIHYPLSSTQQPIHPAHPLKSTQITPRKKREERNVQLHSNPPRNMRAHNLRTVHVLSLTTARAEPDQRSVAAEASVAAF